MKARMAVAAVALGAATVVAPTPAAEAGTKPNCPQGALVVIPFGMAPACTLGGRNDLWVRFPDSNRAERARWAPTCQRMAGRMRWWLPIGQSPNQGEYVCRWVDPAVV